MGTSRRLGAPAFLAVLGFVLLGVTVGLSVTSLHANPLDGDPTIHCGSLVARHHFPDGYYTTPTGTQFAERKCDGARTKRTHRVLASGGLGVAALAAAVFLRRRDRLGAGAAPREGHDEVAAHSP